MWVFVLIGVRYIVKVHRTVTVKVLLKVTLKVTLNVTVKVLKMTLNVLPYYFLFYLSESRLDTDVDYRLNQDLLDFTDSQDYMLMLTDKSIPNKNVIQEMDLVYSQTKSGRPKRGYFFIM